MRLKRIRAAGGLVVCVALVTVACGGGGGKSTASKSASTVAGVGPPKSGGTLTFGTLSPVTSLDPISVAGTGSAGGTELGALYGYLMRFDVATKQYVPYMAQSLTPNGDFSVWTLTLRPNVKFTDGTPFDSNAVITNLKRDMNPANRATAAGRLSFIGSMADPDDHTVVLTLKRPWAGFPYALASIGGVIAAPSYLAKVDAGDKTAPAVGAGPFVLTSFRANEELTMSANKGFFAGAPYLDRVIFVNIAGGSATLQAFETGQTQAALITDPLSVKAAKDQKIPNFEALYDLATEVLVNNRKTSPFADQRLREAVAMGIDLNLYNQRVQQGLGVPSDALFPQESQWYDPAIQGVPYDPVKAKALVTDAKAGGFNGTVRFFGTNAPDAAPIPVALLAMLEPLGFKLQTTLGTSAQSIVQVIVKKDFDLASFGAAAADFDPFLVLYLQLYSTSPNNFSGYSNPQMDAAIDALRVASTRDAQKSALDQVAQAWNADPPFANLGTASWLLLHKANVQGLSETSDSVLLFDKAWFSS
jgi:peptide/nickel transport system substrate-binding protein